MKISLKRLALGIASAGLLTIYGCGGGGGGTAGGGGGTPSVAQLTGTAATGAALANAPVTIMNSAGNSPCVETSISTTDLGSYTCTLRSGESAPFFIKVTDPTGNTAPLVSIATQTPAAGTPLTVNATPLTTAIIAQLNNGNALGVFDSRTFVAADLATATANVLTQLASVLTAIGAPAGYDPFTTSITAATSANTGNTADQLLDIVKIGTDPSTGQLALSTITNPTPVLLASATSTGTPLTAPTVSASDLGQATQIAAATFANCFALAPAQRATVVSNQITGVAPECDNIATNGSNATGAPAFLHNGYTAGQFFYGLLTSSSMTGAKFSVPEIMAFYPADTNNLYDRAILNMRYVDNAGNPGNVITVAANIPNTSSSTRPTNWWLVGNQQVVDTSVKLAIRRVEQVNTGTLPTSASPSRFQSGITFSISTVGPNSGAYSSAQVTGPGLPTTGLWYFKNSASTQAYMDISNYRPTTSTPNPVAYSTTGCTSNCPLFWFGKTQGITGTAATAYATNPASIFWAKGGTIDGSFNGSSGTRPKKGDPYTINLYSGITLYKTVTKVLLSDLVDPALGSQLPWNTPGTLSPAALNPNNTALNGQQSSLTLDWVQNLAAQQIGSAHATTINGGAYSNATGVAKGATSVTISSGTSSFTDILTTTIGAPTSTSGFRGLIFNYRMLDGSAKSAQYTYN